MKSRILILIFIAFAGVIRAASYCFDATNGNDSNSGLSAATPWKTLQMVKTSSFMSGDSILLKRGEDWYERLGINSLGNGFAFITLDAHGSGVKPVVTVVTEQNRLWVDVEDNRWETTLSYNPRRVLKDGVEILEASYGNPRELGTYVPDLVEWDYDYDNETLTLFSADSPTSHIIEFPDNLYALNIAAEHYLKIENIEFVGGYNYCAAFSSCTDLQLKNLQIGAYANSGLYLSYYKVNGDTFQFNRNIGVDSCVVDSKYDFDYGQASITSYVTVRWPREGVIFRGTFNSELKNCLIKDSCHADINIFVPIDSLGNPIPYGAAPDIGIFEHQEFVGVASKRQPDFILYPNPVREITMLYLKKQYNQVTVSITTTSGKEIFFEKRNHVSKIPLTLKGSAGLYLVSVCADDG